MGNRKSIHRDAPSASRQHTILQPIPRSSLSSSTTQETSTSYHKGVVPTEFAVDENPLAKRNHKQISETMALDSRQHSVFRSRSTDAVGPRGGAAGTSQGELKRGNLRGSIRKVWSALFESTEKIKKRADDFQSLSLSDTDTLHKVPRSYADLDLVDCWHYMLRELLNGNYTTKLNRARVRNILHVGAGNGKWCIEMAQEFPYANVIGIEESRVRVYDSLIPPNCSFRTVPNFQVPFPLPLASFDFIYVRILTPSIPQLYFIQLYRHLHELLRPGGRIEIIETNMLHTAPSRPYTLQMNDWITEYFQLSSRNIAVFENMETMLCESGFQRQPSIVGSSSGSRGHQRATIERLTMPTGSWAGRIGEVALHLWLKEGERFAAVIGITGEQFRGWKEGWVEEVENQARGKWRLMVVRAKKERA